MFITHAICLLYRPTSICVKVSVKRLLEFHKCIAFYSISCLTVAIVSKGLANMFNVAYTHIKEDSSGIGYIGYHGGCHVEII